MPGSLTVTCIGCFKDFQASRKTATFCGGLCRQRFNRFQHKVRLECQPKPKSDTQGRTMNESTMNALIEHVYQTVEAFAERVSVADLACADVGPLEMASERLHELANPICAICEEREADGWEEITYCRRCEIQVFDLHCNQCDERRPSVKSDEGFCARCEKEAQA